MQVIYLIQIVCPFFAITSCIYNNIKSVSLKEIGEVVQFDWKMLQ